MIGLTGAEVAEVLDAVRREVTNPAHFDGREVCDLLSANRVFDDCRVVCAYAAKLRLVRATIVSVLEATGLTYEPF